MNTASARRTSSRFRPYNGAEVTPASIVAHHEAGHAVVAALAFREMAKAPAPLPVAKVWIDVGDTLEGDGTRILGRSHTPIDHTALELLEWSITINFAGGLAEAIHRSKRTRRGAWTFARARCGMSGDLEAINHTIAALRTLTDDYDCDNQTAYQLFVGRAWGLLKANWDAVERVAQALIEKRRLDGAEVEALINGVIAPPKTAPAAA